MDFTQDESQTQREGLAENPEGLEATKIDYGLLIEAIQGFEYLYDLSHRLYKDAKKKQQAWQQISDLLNCSVEECMKTWKNLRDRFVKERKIQAGSSGAEAIPSNWPYFDAMLFYGKYTRTRNTYTATETKKKAKLSSRPSSSASVWSSVSMESLTSPETLVSVVQSEGSSGEENDGPRRQGQGNVQAQSVPSVSRQTATVSGQAPGLTPTTTASRKRKLHTMEPGMERVIEIASSLAEKLESRPPPPKNSNSTFVEYLYQELERLSEEDAKKKRKEILTIFFKDD